ncbi:hypothetical protein ABK040_014530 [Willaertia magna]
MSFTFHQEAEQATALLDALEQSLGLNYNLFPPSLYVERSVTVKSTMRQALTIPMYMVELDERYPKDKPFQGFSFRSFHCDGDIVDEDELEDDFEEQNDFFLKREAFLLERIHQLMNLVEKHQDFANKIRTESVRVLSTISNQTMGNNLTQLVLKGLDINLYFQLVLSSRITEYIKAMCPFAEEEGVESLRVETHNLSTNVIETKLNSSCLTASKMAAMNSIMEEFDEMMDDSTLVARSKSRLQESKEEVAASTKPPFSSFTSALSRYCKEIDNKREEIRNRYSNKETARNIVEARCKKLTNEYCNPVIEASLSNNGDFYAAVCEDEEHNSLKVFFDITSTGTLPITPKISFKDHDVRSVCCDGDNSVVWISINNQQQKLYGYKLKEENNRKFVAREYCLKGINNFQVDRIVKLQNNLIVSPSENLSSAGFASWNINDLQNISNPTISRVPSILSIEDRLSFLSIVPNKPSIMFSNGSAVYHLDLIQEKYTNVFVGFGGLVTEARYESGETMNNRSNLFVASSFDTRVYVFDNRLSTPIYQLEGHSEPVRSSELVNIDGTSFVFSSGEDESIRCWDLRMQLPLYELSTGNSTVKSLHYHKPSNTLISGCDFRYNRFGDKRYGFRGTAWEEDDEDDLDWPKEAKHEKDDFKEVFDAEDSMILRYKFTSS